MSIKRLKILCIKFGIKVGMITSHHFAKLEQNRSKGMDSKRENLNFGKDAKNWHNSEMTRVGHYFKTFRNSLVKTFHVAISKFSI